MLKALVVLSFLLLLSACDSQKEQNDFVDEASRPPSGYAATDATGLILSDDEDDWRTAPFYFGKIRLDPAFPNPTIGQWVTIPIFIQEFNAFAGGLVLRVEDNSGILRSLDELLNTAQPGAYVLRFNPAVIGRTGLVRVLIFDRVGDLVSYGDVNIR